MNAGHSVEPTACPPSSLRSGGGVWIWHGAAGKTAGAILSLVLLQIQGSMEGLQRRLGAQAKADTRGLD